jgi:hypothetical protein
LGIDAIAFYLFPGLLVLFCPLATLLPIGRWNHIGGDAYNVSPLHPIIVEIRGVTKIKLPFHSLLVMSSSFLLTGQPIEVCLSKHTKHERR